MKCFVYTVFAIVIASNTLFAWQTSPNRLALSLYRYQNERNLKEIPHFQLLEQTNAPDLRTRSLPIVSQVTTAKLLGAPLARLLRSRPELVEISVPWDDSLVRIQLFADQPHDQDFLVKTSDGASFPHNALHYRGILKDDDRSLAAISIFEDQIIGIVSSAELGNLVIGQWAGKAGDHVIYREADLLIQHQTDCVAELAEGRGSDSNIPTPGKRQNGDCVKVYFEVAHALYKAKGSNVENVTNYVSGLFNVVSTLYDNEGINIEMSELYVWTGADPYSHGSSLSALNTFRNNRPSFRGDIGHLLDYTTKDLGGRGYIDVLCNNSSNYAYSDIDLNYAQFPTYSWTVNVVTHEIGHNLGSPHTHACAWGPSGNRALDNCFGVEGNCIEGPDPGQSGGTIMSYCHLGQGNPGVNFINGFGPEPGELIRQKVAQAACLTECGSGDTGGVCNLSITNVQVTNASCGQNNGRLSIQVTGASGVVTYDIGTGPQTSNTFQNLGPGVYTISVDNGASCERFTSATVAMMSSPPTLQAIVTNATCSRADGKIELSVTGGEAPFRYKLGQKTQNNAIFSALSAGDYQAQVTDANGCTSSKSITVFTEDAPELTVKVDHTTCGLDNGVISLSVDGGQTPYRYILNEDHYESGTFESLPPGAYNVRIEDANGCTDEQQLSIAASDPIEAEVLQTPTTCGLDNGTFQVVADGGRAPLTYSLGGPFTPNAVFNALPSGSYQITVRDADNCRVQFAESIAPSDGLDAEISVSSTQCGQDDGVISLSPKGNNGPFTFSLADQPVQEDSIFSGLKAGLYEVMVWDQAGCQRSYAVTVDSSSSPIAELHTKHTTCGQINGLIQVQVSGGVGPYEFDFGEGFYQDSVLTDLAPGQYHLRVRDQIGCLDSVSSMIDESQPLQTNIVVEGTTCGEANGIVSFARQSGLQPFLYQLGDTTLLDSVISHLPAGEYPIIIVDAAGCTQEDRIKVDSSPALELLTEVQSTTCGREDGALTLLAAGGTGNISYALDSTFTSQKDYPGLPAGRYQVSVRDEMDCVVTEEVEVMPSTKPKLHVEVTHTRCGENNAHLELTASGGLTPFQFSLDGQPMGIEVGDLAPGSYTVMVEDSLGCKDSTSTDIRPSSAPQLDYKVWPAVCNQANGKIIVEGSGGTVPYQFISKDVALKDTVLDQLESGWYSVGLIDAEGCLDSLSIEVPYDARFQPPELVENLPICDSDPAVLSTGLPDSIEMRWFFNGQELQEVSPVLLAHEPGIYQVEAIYSEQCKLGAEARVFQRQKPKVSLVSKDTICLGQPFEVAAASDSLTYRWSNDSIGQSVYFQHTDYYRLTVTDSVGCAQEAAIDLEVISPLQLSSELDDYRVCTGKALEIEVRGGESYLWSAPGLSFEPGSSQQSIETEQDVVIQVIGFNACYSDTLDLYVGVVRQPDFLPSDTMIIEGSPLRISTPVAKEVIWLSDYTLDCDSCIEVQVRPEESGSITLNYLDQQGCNWEETLHVEVIPLASIFPTLVNVITPNGDGYNDILFLPGLHEFDQVGIEVFDTHGSKVYEDRDYDNDWNGTMNGQSLNEGIYFYILTLRLDDRVFRLDSDLTVIR